jgi:hypothetical protein
MFAQVGVSDCEVQALMHALYVNAAAFKMSGIVFAIFPPVADTSPVALRVWLALFLKSLKQLSKSTVAYASRKNMSSSKNNWITWEVVSKSHTTSWGTHSSVSHVKSVH